MIENAPRFTWYRNAGSKRLHKPANGWVQHGRAVCGANISRAGYAWDGPGTDAPEPFYTRLDAGRHRFGIVKPCGHCVSGLVRP